MPRYLQRRRRRWYAVLEVPKALRGRFGRRLVMSLGTESLSLAEKRVLPVIVEWKRKFETQNPITHQLQEIEKAEEAGYDLGDMVGIFQSEEGFPSGFEEAAKVKKGDLLLSLHLEEYLSTIGHLQQKTQDMRRRDIKLFCNRFKFAQDATRNEVIEWVEGDLMDKDNLSPATCNRIVGACRGYWTYLERRKGLTQPMPFQGVVTTRTGKKQDRRKAFRPQDLGKLLSLSEDTQLNNLILLGAYTGARIEELCSLKLEDVTEDRFFIEDAKTEAGNRIVPIHREILSLVAKLKEDSSDGYLLSGLTFNKYGDRSNAIGKRFGRLKAKAGYNNQYVFHSFRKGVITQLEAHQIPEFETARLVGHDIPTITYGLYSGGHTSFERLQEVINLVSWHH